MPISLSAEAIDLDFVDASIRVALADGREVSAPIAWPDIDEDVSVNALLGLST
jgi:hypothetical protein